MRVTVDLTHDESPQLPSLPLTHMLSDSSNQAFFLSSISPHGHPLSYSLGSPLDYGDAYAYHPQSVSIDPTSGRLVFNTSHVIAGDYSVIVAVTDLITNVRVAMEILITVNTPSHWDSPPYWTDFHQDQPTIGPHGRYIVAVGDTLSVNLTASHEEPGDNITLISTTSLPAQTELSQLERMVGVRNTGLPFSWTMLCH